MYFYNCGIIDWEWENLLTLNEMIAKMAKKSQWCDGKFISDEINNGVTIEGLIHTLEKCLAISKKHLWWEGDFREEPRIFMIPDPDNFTFKYGFAWKQDNNGSTFVASEIELPHIAKDAFPTYYLKSDGTVIDLKPARTKEFAAFKERHFKQPSVKEIALKLIEKRKH
jgi:hypothetical protein